MKNSPSTPTSEAADDPTSPNPRRAASTDALSTAKPPESSPESGPIESTSPIELSIPEKLTNRPVLYPNKYCWFVLLSALDIMLTHTILFRFDVPGFYVAELNTFADWVIKQFGLWGAVLLKCLSITVVIVIIEIVGRRRPQLGSVMSSCVVAMATVPVFAALVQLLAVAVRT